MTLNKMTVYNLNEVARYIAISYSVSPPSPKIVYITSSNILGP